MGQSLPCPAQQPAASAVSQELLHQPGALGASQLQGVVGGLFCFVIDSASQPTDAFRASFDSADLELI